MSNTTKRILSAIVLIGIVLTCVYLGAPYGLGFTILMGAIIVHELSHNFFKRLNWTPVYFLNQALFIGCMVFFHYFWHPTFIQKLFLNIGLIYDLALVLFLVYVKMERNFFAELESKMPLVPALFVALFFLPLGVVFQVGDWARHLGVILFITAGMDTGAWFFGKNFGKHKLWPTVSPNKTIEGLIGGAITAGILGGAATHLLLGNMGVKTFFIFVSLGILSQIGDLIQSKIKRQAKIKDSSHIIPGHGGVYDRLDSLIFVSPFYLTALKYSYLS